VCVPNAPRGCYDYTGIDFGLCKMLMGWAVQDGVCQPISGCGSDLPFHPSREACMADCAVDRDETCHEFSESDPNAFVHRPCADGLKCTRTTNMVGFNVHEECKPMDYCVDATTAAQDCEELPHIAVPGIWGCVDHRCKWRTGPSL
jgi:hypothetical protein